MNSKKAKWLALAALLMFVGAVFQIANDHFILGIVCFGAAAAFTTLANVYRERAKKKNRKERVIMNKYIAYCGLDCETCEARIATVGNDDALREKVARNWSELNGVEITPDMINCVGCRISGAKTPYCESLCPIRQCALNRNMETCGSCSEMETCEKLGAIIRNNADAKHNLEN